MASEGRTGKILQNIIDCKLGRLQGAAILSISLLLGSSVPYIFNEDMKITLQAYAAVDSSKPIVIIEKPASGAKLPTGTITISGKASDNSGGSGIQSVEMSLDDGSYKAARPKAPGDWSTWLVSFSVTAAGSHEFKAKATDRAGNKDWDAVAVSVGALSTGGSPDTTDPKIAITYPADGSSVAAASSITVRGTASDSGGSGISTVQVRVDSGSYKTAAPKAPGDWSTWSVTVAVTAGEHRLVPRATDKAGNQNWNSIYVTIEDSSTPPPPDPDPDDDIPAPLRKVSTSSLSELKTAISQARAGDQITLRNGVYTTTSAIQVSAKGTSTNPIVITAESVNGVEIAGSYGFSLAGAQHVIVRGFMLTHSQDNADPANRCDDCLNVRFTANTFALKTIGQDESDWLGITGSSTYVRVDHNTFRNKPTQGVFLLLLGEGSKMVQNTIVDHNLFRDQTYNGDNGGECMRVGFSGLGPAAANSVVEHNIFERCNGDPEAITVKSSNNIFRYNLFKDTDGSLVFRHGSANTADGNAFVDGSGGIRAYGANQKIINNYFANNPISSVSVYDPIIIGRGSVLNDLSTANAEYSQARNILIAHNTFVGNRVNMVIGAFSGSYLPQDITVANNIITGSSGQLVQVLSGDVKFSKNILYPTGSATVGNIPAAGYMKVNPLLLNSAGTYRPSAASPAVDAIYSSEAYGVIKDIDGQTRSGKFDIGADEYRATDANITLIS